MTANEFKRALTVLGWTHDRAARELGTSRRTITRYVQAEFPVPKPIELAIKYFLLRNLGR
jgi:DNA-binding XRE family transcriptional regulator